MPKAKDTTDWTPAELAAGHQLPMSLQDGPARPEPEQQEYYVPEWAEPLDR